jgi:hypothetical protein
MAEEEVISALMEALKFFREQYLSSAYSTMGFTVIGAGWLITSRSARVFIHSHRWLGILAAGTTTQISTKVHRRQSLPVDEIG